MNLCSPPPTFDSNGAPAVRDSTLLKCIKCSCEEEFECLLGNIWISKLPVQQENHASPVGVTQSHAISPLSNTITVTPSPRAAHAYRSNATYSPYVVQFFDAFPGTGCNVECIVLEYMRWGSLQQQLSAGCRPFTESEVAVVAYSVLNALQHIHKHDYIHRDVKVRLLLNCRLLPLMFLIFLLGCTYQRHSPATSC